MLGRIKNLVARVLLHPLKARMPDVFYLFKFKAYELLFRSELLEWKPDVIHAHDLVTLPGAVHTARKLGAKVIYDAHEFESDRSPPLPNWKKRYVLNVEGRNVRKSDAVMTVGEKLAEELAEVYKIKKPFVVHNTPDYPVDGSSNQDVLHEQLAWETTQRSTQYLPHWSTDKPMFSSVRHAARATPGQFIGIYVGKVTASRGIDIILNAAQYVPSFKLVTVGPKDNRTFDRLKAMAEKIGVAEQWVHVPAVPPFELVNFISDADFVIHSGLPSAKSYEWSMPNKLFEATIMAGLPTVSSDLEEISKFVREHERGVIYHHDDPFACARAILALTENIENYRPSEEKKRQLRSRYNWRAQCRVLNEVYKQACPDWDVHEY